MKIKMIIYGVLLFLFATFIIQNIEVVNLKFLFWDIQMPRAILLFITFALGAGFWALLPFVKTHAKADAKAEK
ncbi:MAG: lipopolysaccharide assembly protein LapA domain-containing protein [Thalassotalea sp.]